MKAITFNFNGIRAASKKDFFTWLHHQDADLCFFQELKAGLGDMDPAWLNPTGFSHAHYHYAQKKGYSGVGLWSRVKPLSFKTGFGVAEFDEEGRYAEAEFENLIAISAYFPSGSAGDHRHQSKLRFLAAFMPHWQTLLQRGKPILLCGDINIAHQELDLKNWKGNLKNPGFTPEERTWMTDFLKTGVKDIFRTLHPTTASYTWWSQRGGARSNNVGWRIDYQLATDDLATLALTTQIYKDPVFSDHAPLEVVYDFKLIGASHV